ncbi:hypothetical protein GE09DRAFT_764478 [Coniochaeta sp. 2T2.1]|nr:hypothetical protein GE09DRAFT_764478 [Coniochaeta sp. 2T2.1]
MYVHTSELSAFTTIFLSVGPVISTRRSTSPGAGGAPFHVGFSRMCLVSGRKSGRAPRSSSAWRTLRRSRRVLRVALKDRWRRARKARAWGVRIFLCSSLTLPRTETPWRMESMEAIVRVVLCLLECWVYGGMM